MASTETGHVWSAEGARYAGQPEDAREADAPVKEAEEQLRRTLRKPQHELHPCELKEADSCTPDMIFEDLNFGSRPSMGGPPAVNKQVEPELECDSEAQTEDRTEHSVLSTAIKDCPKPPTERAQQLERMERAAPHIWDSEHLPDTARLTVGVPRTLLELAAVAYDAEAVSSSLDETFSTTRSGSRPVTAIRGAVLAPERSNQSKAVIKALRAVRNTTSTGWAGHAGPRLWSQFWRAEVARRSPEPVVRQHEVKLTVWWDMRHDKLSSASRTMLAIHAGL
jgi:hypothetical protein